MDAEIKVPRFEAAGPHTGADPMSLQKEMALINNNNNKDNKKEESK